MSKLKGYISLVLHAHLPFVRHPEEKYFLEENWLYEAITETYLPLIKIFDDLIKDKVDFRVTMSLTPPLISMLQDPLLQARYITYIDRLIELSQKEIQRTKYEPHFHALAVYYHKQFKEYKHLFSVKYKNNLIHAFKKFLNKGCLEIIASSATHGFLPILSVNERTVRAQVKIGVDHYIKTFGQPPKGIWLPECAYYEGLDVILKEYGLRYFFVDSHGLANADPTPRYSIYAPVYCPSGVGAFARDYESSKQVWSAKEGYPGDYDYREYYRDIGHELEMDYISPYIHPLGIRINTGIKYKRITGNTEYKEVYRPALATEKAAIHAGNFMFNKEKQIEYLYSQMDRKPIVIAPYDAELFGHWWYEGPQWINFLIRKIAFDQQTVKLITPSEYLSEYPVNQKALPAASTWGYKGYNEFWVDGSNDWIYPHIHMAGQRMSELADKYRDVLVQKRNTKFKKALNQAARELLLAESSDWPFIMKAGTMVPYANKRLNNHIGRFTKLYEDLMKGTVDLVWLKEVENRDNIFTDMDCAAYYLEKSLSLEKTMPSSKKKPVVKKRLSRTNVKKAKKTDNTRVSSRKRNKKPASPKKKK